MRPAGRIVSVFVVVLLAELVCLASLSRADDRSVSAPDAQDVIFLGPLRPITLRLRITIDGKPFRQAWQERIDELFGQEDRDHSGRLTLEQARSVIRDMNGSLREEPKVDPKEAARDDGTLDRAALTAYLERNLPPFVIRRRAVVAQGSALALFPLLDTDHNHQLSARELAAAPEQLKQRDFNDDGTISAAELILDPNAIAAAADPTAAEVALDPNDAPLLLVGAKAADAQIADKLLEHYDRNRDGNLSTAASAAGAQEIRLPIEVIGRLDANRDNLLDRQELEKFADRAPDLELFFALGRAKVGDSRRKLQPPADPEFRVRKTLYSDYDIDLGEAQIHFVRGNRDPKQADLVNLRDYDRDNNSYIDQAEASANNIGPAAFAVMDADGDGKVFNGEFTSFMDRQNMAAAVRLRLAVSDLGQDFFGMLDMDGDGTLSARELRSTQQLLASADKNGDGTLNGDEVPQKLEFELVRGVDDPADTVAARVRHAASTAKANSSGPLWFRKMDRNNDGDLSVEEFIGPLTAFEKLDADHDGLIDRAEAEAAGK